MTYAQKIMTDLHLQDLSLIHILQKKHGISERKAENLVDETDERRSNYQSFYAGTIWGYSGNYDICLDVTKLGVDRCV